MCTTMFGLFYIIMVHAALPLGVNSQATTPKVTTVKPATTADEPDICKHIDLSDCAVQSVAVHCPWTCTQSCLFGTTIAYQHNESITESCLKLQCLNGAWYSAGSETDPNCLKCSATSGDITTFTGITSTFNHNGTYPFALHWSESPEPNYFGVNGKFGWCDAFGDAYSCVECLTWYDIGLTVEVCPGFPGTYGGDRVIWNGATTTVPPGGLLYYGTQGWVWIIKDSYLSYFIMTNIGLGGGITRVESAAIGRGTITTVTLYRSPPVSLSGLCNP